MTVAICCYCPTCDYHINVAVPPDAIGKHGCAQCGGLMDVFIAQGHKEVVAWHAVGRSFVWTEKGKSVHVTRPYNVSTYCGRPVVGLADPGDVLWYGVCQKCRKSLKADSYGR